MNSSVLWVFLIAAWVFILLPMVLRGRPQPRKSTEAAQNTRLLHRGGDHTVRRPAAGRHPSAPERVRSATATATVKRAVIDAPGIGKTVIEETIVVAKNVSLSGDEADLDVTDVIDAVEVVDAAGDSEVVAADEAVADETAVDETAADADTDDEVTEVLDVVADETDVVEPDAIEADGTDADEPLDEVDEPIAPRAVPRELRGRGGMTREVADAREARRYTQRRLTALGLAVATIAALVGCFVWQPYGFVAFGMMAALVGLYLFFLRRTAIAEEQYRAQRAERLRRHAREDEQLRRREAEQLPVKTAAPTRRRPGGLIVLEFDDEDPAFDHLPTYDYAVATGAAPEVGDDYRRAV